VRISWRPRNAPVAVVLVAGLIAVAGGVLPGRVSLAATATPAATATATATPAATATATATPGVIATARARDSHPATRTPSSAALALSISVSDGRTAANPGDQLTYLVSVRDAGTVSARHLKITQTLSPGLDFLSAIPAGGTKTFRVVARVTRTPARLLRLAAIACASAEGSARPIVCAAHLDRLPALTAASASQAAGTSDLVPLGYAAAALAVLAVAVLAVIARRRRA
jgi:uncharacterized repeat protein (TIGR01451 family)